MTKEILIKSALRALVNEQVKQGSWGYALEEDSAYEVSWQNVLEWLELQPSKDCISREDILKSFKEIKFYTNHTGMRVVQLIDVIDCVLDAPSVQPKTNVLDKIRAEIEQLPTKTRTNWDGCCPDAEYPEIEYVDVTKNKLLSIINKYTAEEALDVTTKVLEQQPCEDCISRKAVLDYLDNMPSELTSDGRRMVRRIALEDYISVTLPSVTPSYNSVKTELDCISRKAVDTLVDELARAISDERCFMSRGRSTSAIMQDILDLPSVISKTDVLDEVRTEIEQATSRYSISKERGGMGQVEWSDRLIKESDVLQIIDKYKAESEEVK